MLARTILHNQNLLILKWSWAMFLSILQSVTSIELEGNQVAQPVSANGAL